MTMTKLFIVVFLMLVQGCSSSEFGGSSSQKSTGNDAAASGTTRELTAEDPDTASEPISVGGAFLVCDKTADIYCLLKDKNGNKFVFENEIETTVTVDLFSGPVARPARFAWQTKDSIWHWKLNADGIAVSDVAKVKLHLAGQADRNADFEVSFTATPIRLGDGGSSIYQVGCVAETLQKAVQSGISYSREVTLGADQTKIFVTIKKLCGVFQPNTDSIILQRDGVTIKEEFLPKVATETETSFNFSGLREGTYSVVLMTKKVMNFQYDDIVFSDMIISR